MFARAHHQLLKRNVNVNSISDWFGSGGDGFWYHVDPAYCFTDALATTNAAVGQNVRRITDRGGHAFFASNTGTLSTCPVLQFDATLGRYYLDFTAASTQRLGTQDSSALTDWTWLHNGVDEWQLVTLAQFGKNSNPGLVMAPCGTNSATFTQFGAVPLYMDDRVVTSRNNGLNVLVSGASGTNRIVDLSANNVMTPNVAAVYSACWTHDAAGDDVVVRVDGASVITGEDHPTVSPGTSTPQARLTFGAANGTTLPMDGRIYALAIMRGTGARANVANFEATI